MFDHRSRLARATRWALALTVVLTPDIRAQQRGDAMPLSGVIARALSQSPRIVASRLDVDTRRERSTIVGALPDPVLSLGLMNHPLGLGWDQPMTMNQIQLAQRVPWSGKRSSASTREERLTSAAELDAQEVVVSVVQRVRTVYYRIAQIDRAIVVMEETRRLLDDLRETALAQYEVGSGTQQDVLRAQVAQSRMDADIGVMRQNRVAAAARLNGLLGSAPDAPVGALDLPEPVAAIPPLGELMAMAQRRPAIRAAAARIDAATAQRELAERAHLPDVSVTVGYGHRPDFPDLFSVMVGLPLPLRRGSVQAPAVRESEASEAAATAIELELHNETYAALAERRAEAVRAAEVHALLSADILPPAIAAVESGLSSYRVGSLDFMAVLESRMLVNQYEIERLRLAAEYQSALAAIDALIGVIPGGTQ